MQDVRRSGADLGVESNQSQVDRFLRDPPTACILRPQEERSQPHRCSEEILCHQIVLYVRTCSVPWDRACKQQHEPYMCTSTPDVEHEEYQLNARSVSFRHTSSRPRAAAVRFAAATFSPPDRLFHAAPIAQCVSICLGGGAEYRRHRNLDGFSFDAVLSQAG